MTTKRLRELHAECCGQCDEHAGLRAERAHQAAMLDRLRSMKAGSERGALVKKAADIRRILSPLFDRLQHHVKDYTRFIADVARDFSIGQVPGLGVWVMGEPSAINIIEGSDIYDSDISYTIPSGLEVVTTNHVNLKQFPKAFAKKHQAHLKDPRGFMLATAELLGNSKALQLLAKLTKNSLQGIGRQDPWYYFDWIDEGVLTGFLQDEIEDAVTQSGLVVSWEWDRWAGILRAAKVKLSGSSIALSMTVQYTIDDNHEAEHRGRNPDDDDPGYHYASGDEMLAEGCPDNLDKDECVEWEKNTLFHGDKFKDKEADMKLAALRRLAGKAKKQVTGWMWVIAKDSSGGFIVTVGDPKKSSSKTRASFHGDDAKAELKSWVKDNVGSKVSPNHIMDTTGQRLVPDSWDKKFVDDMPDKQKAGLKLADWDTGKKPMKMADFPSGASAKNYERGIADLKKQVVRQEKMVKELSSFSDILSPKVTEVYTRKERAHLENRKKLLKAVEAEYEAWKKAQKKADWDTGKKIEDTTGPGKGKGEGSDVPDGEGNETKRAAMPRRARTTARVAVDLFVAVKGDRLLGATDGKHGANKQGWANVDRVKKAGGSFEIIEAKGVPSSTAEKMVDFGSNNPKTSFWKDEKLAYKAVSRYIANVGKTAFEKAVHLIFSTKAKAEDFKKSLDPNDVRGKVSVKKTKGWNTHSLVFQPHSYADVVAIRKIYKPEKKHYKDIAEDVSGKKASQVEGKTAASGNYGFTKGMQQDIDVASRRIAKEAVRIAKHVHGKDARTADFLVAHAKRGKSLSAKVLVHALQEMGPKLSADKNARLQELREANGTDKTAAGNNGKNNAEYLNGLPAPQRDHILKTMAKHYGISTSEAMKEVSDRDAEKLYEYISNDRSLAMVVYGDFRNFRFGTDKTAATDKEAKYGMYGYRSKTSKLGLGACSELRHESGRVGSNLHRKRHAKHAQISDYLKQHCKEADCNYSRLLQAGYPGSDMKFASAPVPESVHDWLAWEE